MVEEQQRAALLPQLRAEEPLTLEEKEEALEERVASRASTPV
jgi:hypothetical protein